MDPGYPEVLLCHLLDGGAFSLTQHDAEQPDRHPPGSTWSGSDASCRVGLAIQSGLHLTPPPPPHHHDQDMCALLCPFLLLFVRFESDFMSLKVNSLKET